MSKLGSQLLSRAVALCLVLATWTLAAGCGDDARTTISASLVSPHAAEGAAVLELVGPGLENAGSAVAATFSQRRGDTLVVILVAGTPRPLTFTVDAPDPQAPPTARVLEVAAPDDELRTDLTRYRVEFAR